MSKAKYWKGRIADHKNDHKNDLRRVVQEAIDDSIACRKTSWKTTRRNAGGVLLTFSDDSDLLVIIFKPMGVTCIAGRIPERVDLQK